MKKFNIIAIGGTGMRCAESVVHLCAMGMFDDTLINILALDTDLENGNFARLRDLIKNYQSVTADLDNPKSNSLFSAKIDYFEFSPDYNKTNFDTISHYGDADSVEHDTDDVKWKESHIANLFLTPDMRDMDLQHGYRAQTQMGSMLMFHAIREHAYKNKDKNTDLVRFVRNLSQNEENNIVFLFGSVFGGTGASSIPIIPHAFQDAAILISKDGNGDVLQRNLFGTVMLTNYFSFSQPKEKKRNEVIATSDKFSLNSQAALSFYEEDETVQSIYKRLYLIGRDEMRDITAKKVESVTGGKGQRNPVDYLELAAASASYDFFRKALQHLDKPLFGDHAEIFYRTMSSDSNDCMDFGSFFGEYKNEFMEKCGIMMAASFLFGPQAFAENRRKHESFNALTEDNVKDIHNYFRRFYNLEGIDKDYPDLGWIKEMKESAIGYQGFLFNNEAFDTNKPVDFKYNESLYPGKSGDNRPHYKTKFSSAYSTFKDQFGNKIFDESGKTAVSALMSRTYETFSALYGFTQRNE